MGLIADSPVKRITLSRVVPDPIGEERAGGSEVWLAEMSFMRGEDYLIEAASGTGKSSLCNIIYGARRDFSGTIAFDGIDSRRLGPDDWSRLRCRHIALLPQELRLFPELTVADNIEVKNRLTGYMSRRRVEEMLERLGLADKADTLAGHLSIGQQQRVAAIRTLCQSFDFILLDEPVSHLDRANNIALAALISEEARSRGASVIATSVGNPLLISDFTALRL